MEDNGLDERTRLETRKRKQTTSPHYPQDSTSRTHEHNNLCTKSGHSNMNNNIDLSCLQHKLRKTRNSQGDFNEPHDYSNQRWTQAAEDFLVQERNNRGTTDSSTDSSDDDENQHRLVIQHDTAPIKASRILLNRSSLSQRAPQSENSTSQVVRHREQLIDEILSMTGRVNQTAHVQDSPALSNSRNTPNNVQHFQESPREASQPNNVKSTGENNSDQIVPTRSVIKNNQFARRDLSNETTQLAHNPSRYVPDFNIKFQLNLPIPEIIITKNTDMECIDQMGSSANTTKSAPPLVHNTVNIINQQRQSTNRLMMQQRRQTPIRKEDFHIHHNNHRYARTMPSTAQHSIMDLTYQSSTPPNNSKFSTASLAYRKQDQHIQTSSAVETQAAGFNQRTQLQESLQNLTPTGRNIQSQSESVDLSGKSSTELPCNFVGNRRKVFSQGTQMNTLSSPIARSGQICDRIDGQLMAPGYSCIRKGPCSLASYTSRHMDINCPNKNTIGIQSGNQPCHISKSCNGQLAAPIIENISERSINRSCCCNCQCLHERQVLSHVHHHPDQYQCLENSVIRRSTDNDYIPQGLPSKTTPENRSSANQHSSHEDTVRSRRPAEISSDVHSYRENSHLTREQFTSTADLNSPSANSSLPIASEIMKMYNRRYRAGNIEDFDKITRNTQTTKNIKQTNVKHFEETKKFDHNNNQASHHHNAYIKYNPYILLPSEYNPNNTRWTLKYQQAESGLIELLPSSNVFVDEIRLRYYKLKAKSYNKLARMLLTEIFTPIALNVCSLIDPVKVLKMEVAREKPCLDIHAIIVLLKFLQNYGHTKHWGVFDRQYTLESLRYKLKELKRKFTHYE